MVSADNGVHVYVGLAGEGDQTGPGGLLRLAQGAEEWQSVVDGLPANPQVRALLVHPDRPSTVYAGTHRGVYRSEDRGGRWEPLHCPEEGPDVWSLAFHPSDPDVIFAGHEPCAIYRSTDDGVTWKQMDTSRVAFPDVTSYMPPLAKRVIGIAADPSRPTDMYAAIEVGGLLASRDGGESWESVTDGLYTENHTVDLHGVGVSPAAPDTVFIITQVAAFRSRDRGARWEHLRFGEMFPGGSYCRGLAFAPDDPRTVYLAAGAGGGGAPQGTQEAGALFRSHDLGESWHRLDIGETPPSRMFQVATAPRHPGNVYCCTRDGHFYSSADGGNTWSSSRLPVETSRGLHVYPMACG